MMITITFFKKKKWDNIYEQRFKANDNISYNYTIHAFFRLIKSKYQKTIFTLNW